MSVLIKGMEMPKCCAECDAEGHYENSYGDEYGFFCPFGYKAYTSETRELNRLDDCPLVHVPPYVDLIGRDALIKDMARMAPLAITDPTANTFLDGLSAAYEAIKAAPTIIPTEPKRRTSNEKFL